MRREAVFRGARCERRRPSDSRPSATGLTAPPLTNRCGSAAERPSLLEERATPPWRTALGTDACTQRPSRSACAAECLNSRPSATGLTASPLTNRCGSAAERRAPSPPSASAPPTRQSGSAGFRRRSRPVIMPHHADYLPVLPRQPVRTPSLLQLSAVRYLTNMPCAMRWPCAMRYGSAPRLNRRMPMLPSFWGLE